MPNDFSHLVPDYQDSREDILASFPSIRSKTLETLYGPDENEDENDETTPTTASSSHPPQRRMDKSPKGSVDEAIQDLVNLINAHPSFSTLSSCSGRIALFDPFLSKTARSSASTTTTTTTTTTADTAVQIQEQEHPKERSDSVQDDDDENEGNGHRDTRPAAVATKSGKGGTGGWLLASHSLVEPTILVDLLQPNDFDSRADVDDDDDDDVDGQALSFKMEPMLLHVAAANLRRGRQLLQIALQAAGLRESGLVVTESRVTVALRGQSLALSVPLARRSKNKNKVDCLRPNDEYLVALIHQANRRLQRNFEKIARLFDAIQSQIFQPNNNSQCSSPSTSVENNPYDTTCRIRSAASLPALNLWRHASVVVPSSHSSRQTLEPKSNSNDDDDDQEEQVELLVFGGYGSGPILLNHDNGNHEHDLAAVDGVVVNRTTARRSDNVYRLRRNAKGCWSETWEQVMVMSHKTDDPSGDHLSTNNQGTPSSSSTSTSELTFPRGPMKQNCLGLNVRNENFTAREGLAACLLSCSSVPSSSSSSSSSAKDVIALFGGRQGPSRPLNDLLFFGNAEDGSGLSFQAPIDVRGTPPAVRWGHSFTAIASPGSNDGSNKNGRRCSGGEVPLALVVGGCNDRQTFASVHVLALVEPNEMDGSSYAHLVWTEVTESVSSGYCPQRFYHVAVMSSSTNQIFVFGGLSNAQDLLGAAVAHEQQEGDTTGLVVDTTLSSASNIEPFPCTTPFDNLFGHSVSLLPCGKSNSSGTTLLSIGGIARVAHDDDCSDKHAGLPIRCMTLTRPTALPPPSDTSTTSCCNQDTGMITKQQQNRNGSSWVVQEHSMELGDENDDSSRSNVECQSIVNDLGCLVHHSCNVVPRTSSKRSNLKNEFQVLVVGGGVQGFAFGSIFAKSRLLTVCLSPQSREGGPTTIDGSTRVDTRAPGSGISKGRDDGVGGGGGGCSPLVQQQNGQHDLARERRQAHDVSKSEQQRETHVLYVTNQDAKMVKTLLEEARLLDKAYRMGPAVDATHSLMTTDTTSSSSLPLIAVPVTPDCLDLLLHVQRGHAANSGPRVIDALRPLVQGSGRQKMSFSSSVFAARARTKNAPK